MSDVQTVLGPVEASVLGVTLAHEHLRTRNETAYTQFPHLYDDEAAALVMIDTLTEAREKGLGAFCDQGVAGLGRDVRLMQEVSRASRVHILCGTGYYTFDALPPKFAGRSVEVLADAFVHDIEVGVQMTTARAAYLKCATDAPGLTPGVEKVLRACAKAHRQTGVPIVTHSAPLLRNGLDQLDVFESEGVDPTRVMIGHCGDTDDLEYLELVLRRGAQLGMDRFGMEDRLTLDRRIATVTELWQRGYGNRMILSHDRSIVADIVYPFDIAETRRASTSTLIFDVVIPALVDAGVPEEGVVEMLTISPQRWLAPTAPY